MNSTKIIIISWLLFTLAFYFFFDGYFSLLLLVASCCIAFCLWLSTKLLKNNVKITLQIPKVISKNSVNECWIEVSNQSFLPIAKAKVKIEVYSPVNNHVIEQELLFSMHAKKVEQLSLQIESKYCGTLQLRLKEVEIYDFLGLFHINLLPQLMKEVIVLPDTFSMDIRINDDKGNNKESLYTMASSAGNDNNEIKSIKGYVPGDNVKNIHWKLSSKLDDVFVKELCGNVDESRLLWLDTTLMAGQTGMDIIFSDAMFEVICSISTSLLARDERHSIGWFDVDKKGIYVQGITTQDDLSIAMNNLLRLKFAQTEEDTVFSTELLPYTKIIQVTSSLSCATYDYFRMDAQQLLLICKTSSEDEERANSSNGISFAPATMKENLYQLTV